MERTRNHTEVNITQMNSDRKRNQRKKFHKSIKKSLYDGNGKEHDNFYFFNNISNLHHLGNVQLNTIILDFQFKY